MPSRTPHATREPDQQRGGCATRKLLPARTYPVVLLTVFLISQSPAQIRNIHLDQSFPVIQTASQIWIGTPAGLYQYSQNDDSFKRFALPGGRPGARVRFLYVYKEWLWCVLDSGVAALQIRLNDWLFFNAKSGLPSDVVTGLDFLGDYVWVSTPKGMARFDMLIEQWEVYDQRRGLESTDVADLASDGTEIWLTSGRELLDYNPQFEKWRHFFPSGDSSAVLKRLFFLGDELWLVDRAGLIRFNPQLQRPQPYFLPYLASENLLELYVEGDRLWALTRQGLYYYETQSSVWKEFEGNGALADAKIVYGQVSGQQVWVLTTKGTRLWDRIQRNWEILDYSTGLSSPSYESVSSYG
jgi:ligand-binding sensor domain-containing protein